MKEETEDSGKEKTKTGKLETKWKENGLDERCKEERREKNGRGKREGEKETHYQVTQASKTDPALLHQWDEAVLVQLEASKEHSAHPSRTFPFPSLFLISCSR